MALPETKKGQEGAGGRRFSFLSPSPPLFLFLREKGQGKRMPGRNRSGTHEISLICSRLEDLTAGKGQATS